MTRSAFDSNSYRDNYASQLSELSGAQNVASQDPLSDDNTQDQGGMDTSGSGGGPAFQQTAGTDMNPMMANMRAQRMLQRTAPLSRSQPRGGAGGALDNQSSAGFHPDTMQSAPVYHYTDNAPEDQVKAQVKQHDDAIGAGQDQHGHPDMESVWKATFQDELKKRAQMGLMADQQVEALQHPSWRDKAAMFLDAANRATIIQSQNPMMSQGAAWAAATRGALDGYTAHVQGAHDAILQQMNDQRDAASKAADAAVKRGMDTYGLWAKGEQLAETQRRDEETKRHNIATEGEKAVSDKDKAGKEAKGDEEIMTDKDGNLVVVNKKTHTSRAVTDTKGSTVQAEKPGTVKTTKPDDVTMAKAQDKWGSFLKDYLASESKNAISGGMTKSKSDLVKEARAAFQDADPPAYKLIFGGGSSGVDLSAPPPASANPNMTPPSLRK